MIPVTCFRDKRVAIFGLARTGLDAARALQAGGAEVVCWDDAAPRAAAATDQGFDVADLRDADWSGLAALVLSPGVPLTHPAPHWTVERAREAGVEIIGDTELFFRERALRAPGACVVAITGTNGKSTTTALIGHLLKRAGRRVAVGGNIGTAVLSLDDLSEEMTYVLEMSSYQIDLTPTLSPDVGVLLNVTPDHLDRHGTFETYSAVKARMVHEAGIAIVAVDDDETRRIAAEAEALDHDVRVVSCTEHDWAMIFARGTWLIQRDAAGDEHEIADLGAIPSLRGEHNAQNAAAAVAAAEAAGLRLGEAAGHLSTFPGLAHRMEEVGRRGDVIFVNDSKATNAEAAARSLSSFERIYWIAGGRPKSGGIESLRPYFPRVAGAFLIGEAAEDFARTLDGEVPHEASGDMETAVNAAAGRAGEGGGAAVVLLAPACASFDQFADFEARGDAFRRLVAALDGVTLNPREAV